MGVGKRFTNACGNQLEAPHNDTEAREHLLADRLDGHRVAHQDAGRLGDPRRVFFLVVVFFLLFLIVILLFLIIIAVT